MTTRKEIDRAIRHINRLQETPCKPYTDTEGAKLHSNYHLIDGSTNNYVGAGCYYLEEAYNGKKLVQMSEKPGKTSTKDITGFHTNSKLLELLQAFIRERS